MPPALVGRDASAVVAGMRTLGIGADIGTLFDCLIAGHQHRAVVLIDPQTGVYKQHCDDLSVAAHGRWLGLASVRAALAYGRLRELTPAAKALWYARLWADAAVRPIEPLHRLVLPAEASPAARTTAVAFEEVLAVRWATNPGVPFAFARAFVAAWLGVSEHRARTGIEDLRRLGVVQVVDRVPSPAGRATSLYLPGSRDGPLPEDAAVQLLIRKFNATEIDDARHGRLEDA